MFAQLMSLVSVRQDGDSLEKSNLFQHSSNYQHNNIELVIIQVTIYVLHTFSINLFIYFDIPTKINVKTLTKKNWNDNGQ